MAPLKWGSGVYGIRVVGELFSLIWRCKDGTPTWNTNLKEDFQRLAEKKEYNFDSKAQTL